MSKANHLMEEELVKVRAMLKEEYKINEKTYRITTPFLDRNNDFTEIYIIQNDNGTYKITDDSYTFNELELSSFDFNSSEKRRSLIETIVSSHGVKLGDDNELYVECTTSDFALKKHMLLQCMLKISDLFVLSRGTVKSLFIEDVQNFLEEHDIRATADANFIGRSQLPSNYDFVIPKSKNAPERMIKAANSLDINLVKSIIFSWDDIKGLRKKDTILYTIINDSTRKPSSDIITALNQYGIKTILWSNRETYVDELAA